MAPVECPIRVVESREVVWAESNFGLALLFHASKRKSARVANPKMRTRRTTGLVFQENPMTKSVSKSDRQMNRRHYLRAAGACIALPFLPSIGNDRVWSTPAIDSKLPTPSSAPRMVCVGVALGMYADEWIPKEEGQGYRKRPR